jgi:hypothetical protein
MFIHPLVPMGADRRAALEAAAAELGVDLSTRAGRKRMEASDAAKAWNRLVNKPRQCTKCALGLPEDPFHVCVECSHPDMVAIRQQLLADLPGFVGKLAYLCTLASKRQSEEGRREAECEQARLTAVTAWVRDWSCPHARFVLFRLLAVATWPQRAAGDANPATVSLCAELGGIFDSTVAKIHRLRPLANTWVPWAGKWLSALFDAWNSAR